MDITREHPTYLQTRRLLQKYSDLYVGGEQLKSRAPDYLEMRQKEPPDIYAERLARVFYENYIGSIIDWYAATLFKREPILTFDGTVDGTKQFYCQFIEDSDLRGTSLTAILRQQFVATLIQGRSYLLVDFPRPSVRPMTKAEEDCNGLSRAYVVDYNADDLINWSRDARGALDWVVLRQSSQRSDSPADVPRKETKWLYYDRHKYQIYSRYEDSSKQTSPVLIDEGFHGLAGQNMVPLFELTVSDGLSLMNKAALLQVEHFNKSNALAWALTLGLFAMPVIYSDKEWKQIVGESYYIQLGSGDRFGWTEPDGRVYQIAAENLARLQEEIYRVCYLQYQAGGMHSSTSFSQSGLSKQRDFSVTQEVLRAYGDTVKDYTKKILRAIAHGRSDEVEINVSGFDDFDIGEFSVDLADAEKLLSLGISSPTLKANIFKKLAAKYLSDERQEIKEQINLEIDKSLF